MCSSDSETTLSNKFSHETSLKSWKRGGKEQQQPTLPDSKGCLLGALSAPAFIPPGALALPELLADYMLSSFLHKYCSNPRETSTKYSNCTKIQQHLLITCREVR